MAEISWTTYRCPDCKREVGRRPGRDIGTRLGRETVQCKCGLRIATGQQKWYSLTPIERRSYLFPRQDVVVMGIFLLMAGYVTFTDLRGLWIFLGLAVMYGSGST